MVMTTVRGTSYFAMYVRPIGARPNSDGAGRAARTLRETRDRLPRLKCPLRQLFARQPLGVDARPNRRGRRCGAFWAGRR